MLGNHLGDYFCIVDRQSVLPGSNPDRSICFGQLLKELK